MEEFVDAVAGGAVWGIGFGVALGLVQSAGGGLRPSRCGALESSLDRPTLSS